MKPKQIIAIAGVLIVAFLLAYGISLLQPAQPDPLIEADAEFRALVVDLYDFELDRAGIYVRKQEGEYYLLEVYQDPSEGGGHWSVMKRGKNSVQEIEAGQYCAPSCAAVTTASVPVSVVRYCRTNPALYDEQLIDRENGDAIADPLPYCL